MNTFLNNFLIGFIGDLSLGMGHLSLGMGDLSLGMGDLRLGMGDLSQSLNDFTKDSDLSPSPASKTRTQILVLLK